MIQGHGAVPRAVSPVSTGEVHLTVERSCESVQELENETHKCH